LARHFWLYCFLSRDRDLTLSHSRHLLRLPWGLLLSFANRSNSLSFFAETPQMLHTLSSTAYLLCFLSKCQKPTKHKKAPPGIPKDTRRGRVLSSVCGAAAALHSSSTHPQGFGRTCLGTKRRALR